MKRTPQPDRRTDSEREQAFQDQLKAAILDLVNHMRGDAFYVELNADDRDPLYLVFGSGDVIKRFANALPEDAAIAAGPMPGGADAPPIH